MKYLRVGRRGLLEARDNRMDKRELKFRNELLLRKIVILKYCRLPDFVNSLVHVIRLKERFELLSITKLIIIVDEVRPMTLRKRESILRILSFEKKKNCLPRHAML